MYLDTLLLATKNVDKVREFQSLLTSVVKEVVPVPEWFEMPEEVGTTFQENALIKARYVCSRFKAPALADDSGLSVDALNGAPGVHSARYGGPGLDDQGRIQRLLDELRHIAIAEQRSATFVSVVALVLPDGREWSAQGECAGLILNSSAGNEGFGYDPIFYYPPQKRTFAQMSMEEKNQISHRTKALQGLREAIE